MWTKVTVIFSIAFLVVQNQICAFGIAKPKPKEFFFQEETNPLREEVEDQVQAPYSETDQWVEEPLQEIAPGIYGDFLAPDIQQMEQAGDLDPDLWTSYRIPRFSSRSDYQLRMGDSLTLSIYGEPKTERTVIVDPEGCISYLYVNKLYVSGKTLSQLRSDLEQELKHYFRHALIAITPIKFGADFYTVMGQVRVPGKQPIVGRPTLLKALCLAQGFNLIDYREQMWDMCNLDQAFVSRQGNYIPIDFTQLVREGDLRQNILLESGDFIYIPDRTVKQVFILGEVANQKSVDYFSDMSLIEALADAGNITERASNRIIVLRGSLSCPIHFVIDYKRIARGYAPNFPLEPGDIVYVPPRKLYLLKEIVQSAIASFVGAAAYEAGLELYMRCDPKSRPIFGDNPNLP